MGSAFKKIAFLFILNALIGGAFYAAYYAEAEGPLKAAIAEHGKALREDTIPSAGTIDIYHDDWTKLARFETTQGELSLVVGTLFSFLFVWVLIMGGVSRAFLAWAEKLTKNIHLQRALYLVAFVVVFSVFGIPDTVFGFLTELLRGTSTETWGLVAGDAVLGTVIAVAVTLFINIPFYWIMDRFPRLWWVVASCLLSVYSVVLTFIAPVVIDPLYNTYTPLADQALEQKVAALAEKAGVSVDRVYVDDASARTLESNAQVSGLLGTKRVVLDDTLLRHYSDREILFITAHELGHYAHGDVIRGLALGALDTFISLGILFLALRAFVRAYGKRLSIARENNIVLYPLIGAVIGIYSLISSPAYVSMSRTMEHRADAFALDMTHDPEAGESGFIKLAYETFADPDPPPLLQFWFGDHPTIKERIEFLKASE